MKKFLKIQFFVALVAAISFGAVFTACEDNNDDPVNPNLSGIIIEKVDVNPAEKKGETSVEVVEALVISAKLNYGSSKEPVEFKATRKFSAAFSAPEGKFVIKEGTSIGSPTVKVTKATSTTAENVITQPSTVELAFEGGYTFKMAVSSDSVFVTKEGGKAGIPTPAWEVTYAYKAEEAKIVADTKVDGVDFVEVQQPITITLKRGEKVYTFTISPIFVFNKATYDPIVGEVKAQYTNVKKDETTRLKTLILTFKRKSGKDEKLTFTRDSKFWTKFSKTDDFVVKRESNDIPYNKFDGPGDDIEDKVDGDFSIKAKTSTYEFVFNTDYIAVDNYTETETIMFEGKPYVLESEEWVSSFVKGKKTETASDKYPLDGYTTYSHDLVFSSKYGKEAAIELVQKAYVQVEKPVTVVGYSIQKNSDQFGSDFKATNTMLEKLSNGNDREVYQSVSLPLTITGPNDETVNVSDFNVNAATELIGTREKVGSETKVAGNNADHYYLVQKYKTLYTVKTNKGDFVWTVYTHSAKNNHDLPFKDPAISFTKNVEVVKIDGQDYDRYLKATIVINYGKENTFTAQKYLSEPDVIDVDATKSLGGATISMTGTATLQKENLVVVYKKSVVGYSLTRKVVTKKRSELQTLSGKKLSVFNNTLTFIKQTGDKYEHIDLIDGKTVVVTNETGMFATYKQDNPYLDLEVVADGQNYKMTYHTNKQINPIPYTITVPQVLVVE